MRTGDHGVGVVGSFLAKFGILGGGMALLLLLLVSGTEGTLDGTNQLMRDAEAENESLDRVKREGKTVSNMDIREAIMQLITVIQAGNERFEKFEFTQNKFNKKLLGKVDGIAVSLENKISHMSTFLLRMKNKLDAVERSLESSAGGPGPHGQGEPSTGKGNLQTIAAESFDILSVLPTYIESIQTSCSDKIGQLEENFQGIEEFLSVDNSTSTSAQNASEHGKRSLSAILKSSESNIVAVNEEIKNILTESNYIAESLYDRVSGSFEEISKEMKGISNVEKVLLDTADGVLDTKRKLEFGVRQILFKITEALEATGQDMVESLGQRINETTERIFENQNHAMGNLTLKVEKEIGLVWRQMGIMYGQVSNSISILEKVKDQTETYVKNTGQNLGEMEGTVEGLTDSMVNVDTNLNYMLGQLSLVVREFNQVKTGLTDAMTEMGGNLDDIQPYEKRSGSNGETD
eukprot:TRINITY_DN1744_c0_g1_i1.p1 TRINITY_DN1744_c0_g1~~TRINITY_DN1744_c0_g1_i1.p1  ORF type:complete len:463 (+),score=111.78 TRINITY_DN1744_c0_g1_i1:125-1513(+)